MRFLSEFETENAYNAAKDGLEKPHISIVVEDRKVYYKPDPSDGHPYVEIGGIKWATMNVGAESETDYGLYFQWGDVSGYTSSQVGSGSGKKYFGWEDYKYGNGTSSPGATGMTKYNSGDGKTVLDVSDDAVVAAWGGNWRMPTIAEYEALSSATTKSWVSNYNGSGVKGYVCTDKTDNSKVLFFPAVGYFNNGKVEHIGNYGYFWAKDIVTSNLAQARRLGIASGNFNTPNPSDRKFGFPVRGILDV